MIDHELLGGAYRTLQRRNALGLGLPQGGEHSQGKRKNEQS